MEEIKCRKCGKEFTPIKVEDFIGATHLVDICLECEKKEEEEKELERIKRNREENARKNKELLP